jgi:hypothetical protein
MNRKQVSLALIAGTYVILSTGCESMTFAALENTPGPRHATEGPYSEFVWEALGATPSIQFASEQRASTPARASNAQATAAAR